MSNKPHGEDTLYPGNIVKKREVLAIYYTKTVNSLGDVLLKKTERCIDYTTHHHAVSPFLSLEPCEETIITEEEFNYLAHPRPSPEEIRKWNYEHLKK